MPPISTSSGPLMTSLSSQPTGSFVDAIVTVRKPPGTSVWRFVLIRFALIVPMVLILVTVVFFLMRLTGDPITASLGGQLTPNELASRVAEAGYDRPVLVQYLEFLRGILVLDFGTTLSDHQPVVDIVTRYGSATLELVTYSLIVAFAVSIPFGSLAAYRRDSATDAGLRIFAILAYATPIFFFGLLLKLTFAIWLGIFPIAGRVSTASQVKLQTLIAPTGVNLIDALRLGDMAIVGDVLWHAVLPAVALGLLTGGIFLRLIRTNLIGTLATDYVAAARSRGVGELLLVTQHAFRPALIPIITVMGLQIAGLLGGAVLTEKTFEWKGLGFVLTQYIQARDFVAVQGIVVLLAVIVAFSSFLIDVLALLIDPRVRY